MAGRRRRRDRQPGPGVPPDGPDETGPGGRAHVHDGPQAAGVRRPGTVRRPGPGGVPDADRRSQPGRHQDTVAAQGADRGNVLNRRCLNSKAPRVLRPTRWW